MSIDGASAAYGASLVQNDCTGGNGDSWTRSYRAGNNTFSNEIMVDWYTRYVRCIDVPNAQILPGATPLWSYACNNSVAQQFTLDGVRWKAIGDQCVVVGSTAQNTRLQIQPCGTPGYYERWDFETNAGSQGTRIHLTGTGMCVNVPFGAVYDGNPLSLYPCGSPSPWENEVYGTTRGGEIMYHGMCFNVSGGAPAAGAGVILWDCSATSAPYPNERFHVNGPIHGQGGECLEAWTAIDFSSGEMFVSRNGYRVQLADCGAWRPSQEFDYYFTSWPAYY